jgi:hypothetical protein
MNPLSSHIVEVNESTATDCKEPDMKEEEKEEEERQS